MNLQTKLDEMRKRCEAAKLSKAIIQRFDNEGGEIHYQIELEDVCREDMIFASVWDHKARAEFVKHSTTDLPLLISALEVCLGAIHEAKLWCDVGAVEKGEDYTLSEKLDEALAKAEALLVGEGKDVQ